MNVESVGQSVRRVDRELRKMARRRASEDFALGLLLREGFRLRVHESCGFASFREYGERVLAMSGRMIEERLRCAEALEHLRVLAGVLDRGDSSWSSVRELCRVATEETEDAWIEAAKGCTAREVEAMVANRAPGELPDGPSRPEPQRRRISMTLSSSTY